MTATGTDVGKTWVAEAVARRLISCGLRVAARKPAQSFAPGDGVTDAERLAAATGEDPAEVAPPHRWYPVPMAPPMAAASLGLAEPTLAELAAEVGAGWPDSTVDVGLVEGAGGVASPLAADGDTAALSRALGADTVVIVAGAGLGVIHSVRLAAAALSGLPVVVFLNRYDPLVEVQARSHDWLMERDGLDVTTEVDELCTALTA